ncbi:hypothetical protein RJ639_008207 [Escallonia herrerae]|uniref:Pentatricopeptide repeat-containing protein n=1 Tax=Escallonia herrerae TaxID=1293975 RepID=A0AA88VUZ6_9ASTE|nr:hypothetical protein RJ639_008207 [Escallonia herrerae]
MGDLGLGLAPLLDGLGSGFLAELGDFDDHHVLTGVEGWGHVGKEIVDYCGELAGDVAPTELENFSACHLDSRQLTKICQSIERFKLSIGKPTMHRTLVQLTKICQSIERSCNNCNFHYHVYSLQPFTAISSINFSIKTDPYQNVQHNPKSVHYLSYVIEENLDTGDPRAGLSVHTHLTKLYFNGYTSLWNKLLNLYCKCGQLAYAWKVFETMPERNVVSFNTMILGCIRNGYALQALSLYTEMGREKNVSPNHITLAGLIGACDGVLVTSLHAQALRYGWCCNEYIGSSLVDVYTKEMHLEDAVRAFHEIAELDLVSWNIMIDGCVRNGSKERALKLFARMIQEKVEFDGFTLTSVVKTCLEWRDLDLGMLVHGCALKVCGCTTVKNNGWEVNSGVMHESDVFAWEALFGACRLHRQTALGEKSAKMIVDAQPEAHPYVLLANINAEKELWEDKRVVRENLVVSGSRRLDAAGFRSIVIIGYSIDSHGLCFHPFLLNYSIDQGVWRGDDVPTSMEFDKMWWWGGVVEGCERLSPLADIDDLSLVRSSVIQQTKDMRLRGWTVSSQVIFVNFIR